MYYGPYNISRVSGTQKVQTPESAQKCQNFFPPQGFKDQLLASIFSTPFLGTHSHPLYLLRCSKFSTPAACTNSFISIMLGTTTFETRTPENPHRPQKVPIWGVYGAFRSAISFALPSVAPEVQPGDQYSGVWYHTFRLRRPQIRGFASYIWAPKPEFLGVCEGSEQCNTTFLVFCS